MRISYDISADALCLEFRKGRIIRDEEISSGVFAGFSRAGELIEIQILDISKDQSPWLTVEAAAKILKKSERTILRWISSGKLRSKKVGKEYRIDPSDLEEVAS